MTGQLREMDAIPELIYIMKEGHIIVQVYGIFIYDVHTVREGSICIVLGSRP